MLKNFKGDYFDDLRRDLRDAKSRAYFQKELQRLDAANMVAQARRAKKFTQARLAKAIGMEQSSIARLESGKVNVTVETLGKIGMALGKRLKMCYA